MITQLTIPADIFANNPEPRCPCCLLLDVSASMAGEPIRQLNEGLSLYHQELLSDPLAAKRVQVGIVTFGGIVQIAQQFCEVGLFTPPVLETRGDTPLGGALAESLGLIERIKGEYRANGISYYRPWLFLITDGAPTDDYRLAAAQLKDAIARNQVTFFAVGVAGADFGVLEELSPGRVPLRLEGLRFRELFQWLSNSQRSVSRSTPGDDPNVPLDDPTGPNGWGTVGI